MMQAHFDKIRDTLANILSKHGEQIYSDSNKQLFYKEIRNCCIDDELARDILLTLVVNDIFVFLQNKDFLRVEKNLYNCLDEFQLAEIGVSSLLEILKIADELSAIKKRKNFAKIRFILLALFATVVIVEAFALNYKSYFRTPNDIVVSGGTFKWGSEEREVPTFFMATTEAYDENSMPLVGMSWFEVVSYCNKLSEKYGLECVYEISEDGKNVTADFTKCGYRLPTKDEWYWAAIGGRKRNGSYLSNNIENSVWYLKNSNEKMHNVGLKKANQLGLHDMFGNAAEWIWDSVGDGYNGVCGGFYGSSEKYIGLDVFETKHKPNFGEMYIGFRLVRSYVRKNKFGEKK